MSVLHHTSLFQGTDGRNQHRRFPPPSAHRWKPRLLKQGVELVCRIEIIGLALIGSIGDVFLCQFLDGSEDGIRACMCARSDDTRDDASDAMLHPPRMNRHRSIRSSENE